jgi:hypothetical protein
VLGGDLPCIRSICSFIDTILLCSGCEKVFLNLFDKFFSENIRYPVVGPSSSAIEAAARKRTKTPTTSFVTVGDARLVKQID